MRQYRIKFRRNAKREIEHLPGHIRQRVKRIIFALADNPKPPDSKPLEDELAGLYRIRVDAYRIVYEIFDDVVVVEIVQVGRRGPDTYVNLQ